MLIPDTALFYEKIIMDYINVCNLNYSVSPDPGRMIYRHITKCIDVDLRVKNEKLFLQFFHRDFVYIFEWIEREEEFLQIMGDADRDTERSIHSFMDAIVINRGKYFGLKYGLK